MTSYLRKIEMDRWLDDAPDWLQPDDAVGDQVSDLLTRGNSLSVYALPDLQEKTVVRVAAAISAGRDRVQDVDYVVLDGELLERVSAKIEKTQGRTNDPFVDDWHRDIVQVSGRLLTRLAVAMRDLDRDRVLAERVQSDLVTAIRDEKRFTSPPQIIKYLERKKLL